MVLSGLLALDETDWFYFGRTSLLCQFLEAHVVVVTTRACKVRLTRRPVIDVAVRETDTFGQVRARPVQTFLI